MPEDHSGHRKRMMQKLQSGCYIPDHEILEMLLFPLLPRRNTNDLAHRLLAQFGSIKGVYAATIEELKKVSGIGESVACNLYCTGLLLRNYIGKGAPAYNVPFISRDFLPFATEKYADVCYEVLDLYFLDGEGYIISVERYTNEEIDQVTLDTSKISRLLFKEKPAGIVMVHNHPAGTPTPSKSDDVATNVVQVACSALGVMLCDHIIVCSGNGAYSYYLSGKLKRISRDFAVSTLANGGEGKRERKKE